MLQYKPMEFEKNKEEEESKMSKKDYIYAIALTLFILVSSYFVFTGIKSDFTSHFPHISLFWAVSVSSIGESIFLIVMIKLFLKSKFVKA